MDIEGLKKLAEAAGGGEWWATLSNGAITRAAVCHGDGDVLCECFSNIGHQPEPVFEDDIAQYIAAANPQTVLALIRELEEARKDVHKCLIGERRHGGVEWVNQQPNGWPIGTRFYAAIDAAREPQ